MTCSFKRQGTNTKKDTNQGMLSQHGLGGTQRHCGSDCLEHASVTMEMHPPRTTIHRCDAIERGVAM
eukprot:m.184389 g.184389  ORF g.184389 m.184389 type:complete len:67 (-) comp18488_c0_seq33:167-367(-)